MSATIPPTRTLLSSGEALEEMTPPTLSEHGSALAYHFSRGEVADKAVKYLSEAGDRAAAAL